jgi:hypothetical protein
MDDSTRNHRDWLVKAHHTASQDYDKAVMTLAAGALGLSLAFIDDIAPEPKHVWAIAIAWTLLSVSLLLIFVSFLTSQGAILNEIEKLDYPGKAARKIYGGFTIALNWAAGGAFIVGVEFLVGFAVANI